MRTITRQEIAQRLAADDGSIVIDVMLAETFARQRVPGAQNACVYEVDFLQQVAKIASDKSLAIIVYGSSKQNRASMDAAEKLVKAGYENVADFRGGLLEWFGENLIPTNNPKVEDRVYRLDPTKSKIFWTGRSFTGAHYGTLKLLEGSLLVAKGLPESASFTLDMNSIENIDLTDGKIRKVLEDHLKSEDFFAVKDFPFATFHLVKVVPTSAAATDQSNYQVTGSLEMKNVSGEITFPARIASNHDGSISAQAQLHLDRTRWNVFYGSGRFYEQLGQHLVHDEVSIELILYFS